MIMAFTAYVLFTQSSVPAAPDGFRLQLYSLPYSEWSSSPRSANYSLKYTNGSRVPVTIYRGGFWPNHLLFITDAKGNIPPMKDLGRGCLVGATVKSANRDDNWRWVIAPGDAFVELTRIDLDKMFVLRPGTYSLAVEYNEHVSPSKMRIVSNRVSFVKLGQADH